MSVIQENVRDYVQITFDVPKNYPRDQYGNIRTNVKREPNHLIQQVAEPRNLAGYFWQCAANELEQLGELDFSRCEGFARCRTSLSRNKGAAQKRKWCTPACRVANTRKKGVFND